MCVCIYMYIYIYIYIYLYILYTYIYIMSQASLDEYLHKLKILYFDQIEVFEGIAANETNARKECNIYQYCYFSEKVFNFDLDVCNRCHNFYKP